MLAGGSAIQITSGIFLIVVGIAIFVNRLRFLARFGTCFDFSF